MYRLASGQAGDVLIGRDKEVGGMAERSQPVDWADPPGPVHRQRLPMRAKAKGRPQR